MELCDLASLKSIGQAEWLEIQVSAKLLKNWNLHMWLILYFYWSILLSCL